MLQGYELLRDQGVIKVQWLWGAQRSGTLMCSSLRCPRSLSCSRCWGKSGWLGYFKGCEVFTDHNVLKVHALWDVQGLWPTIVSLMGLFSTLLVAKDEVDPVMKMTRHVVTLECRAQLADEIFSIWNNQWTASYRTHLHIIKQNEPRGKISTWYQTSTSQRRCSKTTEYWGP